MRTRAIALVDIVVARCVVVAVFMSAVGACTRSSPAPAPASPPSTVDGRSVRVSLGTAPAVALSATGPWLVVDRDGRTITRGDSGERVRFSPKPHGVRVAQRDTIDLDADALPLSLVPRASSAFTTFNGRRYRGQLRLVLADTALHVINRVDVESYLRGVVPREIGVRAANERAAVEAQAVAARSYVLTRLGNPSRQFDVSATPSDQVYGGVDSENALANAAIDATVGLALYYGDRIVSGQYYSTCGGTSAEPSELWRSRNEPYLQRVSDRIPNSDRYYCDIAPRFRWERSWRADTLAAVIERYIRSYAAAPSVPLGAVRDVAVEGRTASGRVGVLRIEMERGSYRVRGNDIRNVLRTPGGELLNSTYFTPEIVTGTDGRLSRLTVRGLGYGHGVGMCQWGAIGRARAGQDFRMILRTYYPGTRVARAYGPRHHLAPHHRYCRVHLRGGIPVLARRADARVVARASRHRQASLQRARSAGRPRDALRHRSDQFVFAAG